MKCSYILNGHKFDSEIELDDFLVERYKYMPILGDIVFQMSTELAEANTKIEHIKRDSAKVQERFEEWKRNPKLYWDDGVVRTWKKPRIGVTQFIQKCRLGDSNTQMVPEFEINNYWNRRKDAWKTGSFNNEEIKLFFNGDEDIAKNFTYTENEADRLKNLMEKKWKALGEIGTEIHKALLLFFTKDNRMLYDDELRSLFLRELDVSKVPVERIDDIISYCRKLLDKLKQIFGENAVIYPELQVTAKIEAKTKNNGPLEDLDLMGIIDLVVIDESGKVHILDYKTSTKPYAEFSSAKRLTYQYQLSIYRRMLQKYGLNVNANNSLSILPIQLVNFREESGQYIYDQILPGEQNGAGEYVVELQSLGNPEMEIQNMTRNLNLFLPVVPVITLSTQDLMTNVTKSMKTFFPEYKGESLSDEDLKEWMQDEKMFEVKEDGKYHFPYDTSIVTDSEEDLFNKVKEWLQSIISNRQRTNHVVYDAIKEGLEKGSLDISLPRHGSMYDVNANPNWLLETLRPYIENAGDYELLENDALLNMGCLVIRNIHTKAYDVIKITDHNPKQKVKLAKGTTILGNFVPDIKYQANSKSRMLEAVKGNVDLMEAMFIINNLASSLEKDPEAVIGRIQVINPHTLKALSASNEELLYCYKELNKYSKIEGDNILIENSPIRFASKWTKFYQEFCDICRRNPSARKFEAIRSCKSLLDKITDNDVEEKIAALNKLLKVMDSSENLSFNFFLSQDIAEYNSSARPVQRLQYAALLALAELKNLNLKQQLREHDLMLDASNIIKEGWSGMATDNPGNWKSDTLNLLAKLVMEAHQNTRDDLNRDKHTLDQKVEELKLDKDFSWLREHTIGKLTDLYSRMTYVSDDGDLMCYNPDDSSVDLTTAERNFLRYFLLKINADRFYTESEESIERMRKEKDPRYFRLPLVQGTTESRITTGHLMNLLKERLNKLNPESIKDGLASWWNASLYALNDISTSSSLFFKMVNEFDKSESGSRNEWIKAKGAGYFERNLETLLLKHLFAYSSQRNINEVFPLIKACFVHLASLGIEQNTKLSKDINFGLDYVKNKIRHESIVDPKLRPYVNTIKKFSSAASLLTLAFAPVQFGYLMIDGLWKDIALIIRKPDGHNAFTFEHMKNAWTYAIGDMFKSGTTLCSKLNEIYGLNDMDMNVYADKIKSDKHGLFNFWSLAYKFASRPDYYNRLTIFGSYMRADGCWDAHKLVDGLLVYDWKLDKRFDAYANNDKSDIEKYNRQKGLYLATARQFVLENAKNSDGTIFKIGDALPRAYTNQQAEAYKSICDNLYGYYSDERKSMIHSMFLGSLYMLFRTYWSGAKNQLLEHGGVKLRGHMEHYYETKIDENGNESKIFYYDKINDLGEVEVTTEDTGVPHYEWKGDWQEGLLVSLGELATGPYDAENFFGEGGKLALFLNGELGKVHATNLKHISTWAFLTFGVSPIIAAVLMAWLKELDKLAKLSGQLADTITYNSAKIMSSMLTNSLMDANLLNSVGSPLGSWTPFYLEYYGKTAEAMWKFTVDEDYPLTRVIERTTGFGRQFSPTLDYINNNYINKD